MSDLLLAVRSLADELILGQVATQDTFAGLRCAEVDALARVLVLGGQRRAAIEVVLSHAHADDEADDRHHRIYKALNRVGVWEKVLRRAGKYVDSLPV